MSDQEQKQLRAEEDIPKVQEDEEKLHEDEKDTANEQETKVQTDNEGKQEKEQIADTQQVKNDPILGRDASNHDQQEKEKSDEELEYKPRKDSEDVEETKAVAEQIETAEVTEAMQPVEEVSDVPVVESDIQEYKPRRYSEESEVVDKAWAVPKSGQNTTNPAKSTFALEKEYEQSMEEQKVKQADPKNPLYRLPKSEDSKPLIRHESSETQKLVTNYNPQKLDQILDQQNVGPKYSITMTPEYLTEQKQDNHIESKACTCILF